MRRNGEMHDENVEVNPGWITTWHRTTRRNCFNGIAIGVRGGGAGGAVAPQFGKKNDLFGQI